MNLKKTALSCIMAALLPITANAQKANTANLEKSNTVNYRVGLSHKLNLSKSDIKAIGKVCTPYGYPAMDKVAITLNGHNASMAKTRNSIASQIAPTNRAAYTASDTILFESFEAWDGSFNWMPTDWTEFSASESTLSATTGYNTTWQACRRR
jgi:hypothetical protein